jgi:hypothetical protein
LAKDPGERFDTCTDFARALEETIASPRPAGAASLADADTMAAIPTPPAAQAPPVSTTPVPEDVPKRRRQIVALPIGAAAVLVAGGLVAYFALQPSGTEPPGPPFTLAGTVRLTGDVIKTKDLPSGYECAGSRDYGDVGPTAPITVEDEAGKLLAKGTIGGSRAERDECLVEFRVDNVPPGARFYRLQVGDHEMSYTESEAKAGVELVLSSVGDDPPAVPSASPSKPPPPVTQTRTVTKTPDREQVSLDRLRSLANDDRPYVAAVLADKWIPQISSKRVGLFAKGITWDNEQILAEHQRLRSIYPDVRLLWSGDWSTFDGRNFWITVVGLYSSNPYDVLTWCTQQGFDRDNCIAKVVSTWAPVADSTKMNPP